MEKADDRRRPYSCCQLFADRSVRATHTLRFLGCDSVFCSLCHAEFYDRLRLDLNWFTSLRVPSHAGLAMCFHQAAEAGNHEHAILLRLFNRGFCQVFQESCGSLVVKFELFRQVASELSFRHTRSHKFLLQDLQICVMSA